MKIKTTSTSTPNTIMSTFQKFSLILNTFNVSFCLFILGMITAGDRLPFWPFFILMLISAFNGYEAFKSTEK